MEWKLFAHLRDAAGGDSVSVDVDPDATVEEALAALVEAEPALRAELFEDGALADHIRLLVDGEDAFAAREGLETEVRADTELALFPPVSGG
ncbi:ubiquitin-like small modifier protein 1 [Haloarcula onubensis]|uniref:MoaD family protein n=1 Tax=Haloarcula onubensis TaxID=2950539 RepID=A0ABU2FT03_9EURY|nr:ubiquitin-like small modifier protein 1 [Halomicroarcula sp. S3CR25-11]MDS0283376.1 MoaD family protein [Halomicroarcula sp. S3CR25-11]